MRGITLSKFNSRSSRYVVGNRPPYKECDRGPISLMINATMGNATVDPFNQ